MIPTIIRISHRVIHASVDDFAAIRGSDHVVIVREDPLYCHPAPEPPDSGTVPTLALSEFSGHEDVDNIAIVLV